MIILNQVVKIYHLLNQKNINKNQNFNSTNDLTTNYQFVESLNSFNINKNNNKNNNNTKSCVKLTKI